MKIVSSYFLFPRISWWVEAQKADTVIFDSGEHFQKMSYRNRYRVSGSNNPILLSVPLVNGRNQRIPVGEILIYNEARWQVQHWRSLVSVYKRSPFFEHYEDSLHALFEKPFTRLIDFGLESMLWAKRQLKMDFEIQETDVYLKQYPADIPDLRHAQNETTHFPRYYQVFEERLGFIPDLSILDLLFSEGPGAGKML